MAAIFWGLITVVGPIMLALGLAYAVVRDKLERGMSEQAARRLRAELDPEEKASKSAG